MNRIRKKVPHWMGNRTSGYAYRSITSKLGPKNGDSGSASERYKDISFNDTKIAFASKTAGDLIRAWLILYGCSFSSLVKRADYMYNLSLSVLGSKITHAVIERTLFRHFCAGKDENDIAKPIRRLQSYGVGGILDYAAEAKEEEASSKQSIEAEKLHLKTTAQARVHTYSSESKCDKNMEIFKHAVSAVHNVSPNGFAAVKLSALGEPALLERMSEALVEIEAFFGKLAASTPGSPTSLSYDQFEQGWRKFFNFESETAVRAQFDKVDLDKDGEIDIVDWMSRLTLRDLPKLVSSCKEQGPLYQASLNESELEMMENFLRRVDEVCELAAEKKVRVMIDAEWTAIQPAIDSVVLEMQRKYNTVPNGHHPVVFHTYQTYLIGSLERIKRDLDRSRREEWQFGAKLVRGAYMVSERERANKLGVPSPIWPTYKDTEHNYHAALDTLLKEDDTEVMVASHNERTVKYVLERMKNEKKVYFGQLLGMADHLTFTLAAHQLQAYKYVPYGPVDEVMPYLIRRTQENSTLLGTPAVVNERKMLWLELMRRITPRL